MLKYLLELAEDIVNSFGYCSLCGKVRKTSMERGYKETVKQDGSVETSRDITVKTKRCGFCNGAIKSQEYKHGKI